MVTKGAIRMMSKYLSIKVLCRGHREMLTGYLFISWRRNNEEGRRDLQTIRLATHEFAQLQIHLVINLIKVCNKLNFRKIKHIRRINPPFGAAPLSLLQLNPIPVDISLWQIHTHGLSIVMEKGGACHPQRNFVEGVCGCMYINLMFKRYSNNRN